MINNNIKKLTELLNRKYNKIKKIIGKTFIKF